ncbi:Universal stress protein conatining UspA-like nucleotide-binding region [Rhodospirillaceae bacterium LM-1]|nr:Universal stress protein conatining UspA-like nucleotide-binding region [Rhodospirillaceae bacterium LM-1]
MSIRNILVHLNRGPRSADRLAFAIELAKKHQARLVGAFAQKAAAHHIGMVLVWPPEEYVAAAKDSKTDFEAAAKGLDNAEWIDINRGSDAEIIRHFTEVGRHFDMILLGQPEEKDSLTPDDLAEQTILSSGRPVLFIPAYGHFAPKFEKPMIAWNDSAAAARALNDSLPLLHGAKESIVVTITDSHEAVQHSTAMLTTHLESHGIAAQPEILVAIDIGTMDMLLNRATDRGADLMVIGAFGGYARWFASKGAGTKYLLKHMTLPLLMSH